MKPEGTIPIDDYDHPFWGLSEEDNGYPEKEFIFRPETSPELTYVLEDFLQHNAVFTDGRGNKRHSGSYGTIVEFAALDAALKHLDDKYHPEASDWEPAIRYWLTNPNNQPPLRLVALTIARRFSIDTTDMNHA